MSTLRSISAVPTVPVLVGLLVGLAGPAHAAGLYDTTCDDLSGTVSSVPVDSVLHVQLGGISSSVPAWERREHVRISQGLANALNITSVSSAGPSIQVRVAVETVVAGSSANFTVADIDANDLGYSLDVYLPDPVAMDGSFSDQENGYYKLFGALNVNTTLGMQPWVTVYRSAPGTTVEVGGSVDEIEHFAEPNGANNRHFRECVEVRDDALAVMVPHGGGMEVNISGEMPGFLTALENAGHDPSAWEATGRWNSNTLDRWHITATQLDLESFLGLAILEDAGPYKYALSLHGYADSVTDGVVVGGRASQQVKCFLVQEIEAELGGSSIAYEIHAPGVPVVMVNGGLGDRDDIAGLSVNNIVNRVASTAAGAGGIQLEMSTALRNDATLRAAFMDALAVAMDALLDLNLTDEPVIDYCAML